MTKIKRLVIISGVALAAIFLWFFLIVPQIEKIPQNFSYYADVFSLDNFYDEENRQYLGEQISKTHFSYKAISQQNGVLEVKNIFDVRNITGDKIFSVERVYGVDAFTGEHVKGSGDKDRDGFLFAPKYIKKQDYVYWHINYDEPARMEFQEETSIAGLKVYRYATDYHADQTANLGFLTGVGDHRGVELDINLQLWIEPVSGWLVKYEDQAIAYYYDLTTGRRLYPWNKFSNKYTDTSVTLQAENARAKKYKFILARVVIPAVFGSMILLLFFCLLILKKRGLEPEAADANEVLIKSFAIRKSLLLLLLLLLGGFVVVQFFISETSKQKTIKVGISDWVPNTLFMKNILGFKDSLSAAGFIEGENIEYILKTPNRNKEKQREIIKSFVNEGVDLIYTLTTPGTLIAKGVTQDIPIVFSVVTYPIEAGLVASLENSGNNLVGTRNYIPPSRQYAVFERIYSNTKTLGFVHRKGEPNSTIQYNEFKDMLSERNIKVVDIAAVDLAHMKEQVQNQIASIDSLYAACDTLIQGGGEDIVIEFSKRYKKPSFTCNLDGTEKGSLVGTVAHLYQIGKISGEKSAQILKGVEPAWLRTESPRKNYVVVNLETAEHLNLSVPQDLLDEADKIIAK